MYIVAALAVVSAVPAHATTVVFGGSDFTWSHPSGGATANHIWVAGDYWSEAFAGSGVVSGLQLQTNYDDNTLSQTLNLDVLINGTTVGAFSVGPGGVSTSKTFSFSPITLTGSDILKLLATNTISSGAGSLSLDAASGGSYAVLSSPVPEPATWAMMLVGAGVLGVAMRRRRRALTAF